LNDGCGSHCDNYGTIFRASSLQRLHDIVGSVVILDRAQSIDYKHWQLICDVLRFLAGSATVIILMTATQSLFWNNKRFLNFMIEREKDDQGDFKKDSVLNVSSVVLKPGLSGLFKEQIVNNIQKK
jgi:CRISPR/Cas system-associated endonuclease/helicase Cas3